MRVSARAEYACLAVLDLAFSYGSPEPVRLKRIVDAHGLPHGFLVQILQQLKAAGYVASTRGPAGGYQLTRPPQAISLADILTAIEGGRRLDEAPDTSGMTLGLRALRSVWHEIRELAEGILQRTTFADLVERAREDAGMPVVGDWI